MKKLLFVFAIGTAMLTACSGGTKTTEESTTPAETTENSLEQTVSPSMFGEEITIEEVTSPGDLFAQLESTDTLTNVLISGTINNCCQKKGCWMNVDLGDNKSVFVKFKDYSFFMPMDCSGSTALMQGNVYSETISVDELRHYAEDEGKSAEEVAMITEPEVKYSFMASGVILKDYVPKANEAEAAPAEAEEEHGEEGHDH